MKTLLYLIIAACFTLAASAQNVPMARADGTNIANPSFRDAVLFGTNVSATELGYLDGVTSAIQTQINAKQATLLSGTNIKTVNGSSVLGAGDLSIVSDLSSGPVTSSGGVSAIADAALSIAKTSGLQTALDAKVDDTQLSTTGGPNKIPQIAADGSIRTMAVNPTPTVNPGNPIRISALQRIIWEDYDGDQAADLWMFPDHGADDGSLNAAPELVWGSARHCFYWSDGFQMGDAPQVGGRGWRFLYFNPLGTASAAGSYLGGTLDTQMESPAVQMFGSWWNGSAAVTSSASIQYVPDGVASGELGLWIGTGSKPAGTSARGRILASSGHVKAAGIVPGGIKFPATKGILADGDFTLTQNSVAAIQSDSSGAITNTIRVTGGKVRVGTSAATGAAAYPFEARTAADAAVSSTAGALYVDTNSTVRVGNLTATGGGTNGRLIVQERTGVAYMDINASTATATFAVPISNSQTITSTNTTDATSTATGAIKTSGGLGVAKGIHLGTILTGTEQAGEPAAPAANGFVIFAVDNGGKTELKVKFPTGAAQQLAIEP
jgi:hypothetical protein